MKSLLTISVLLLCLTGSLGSQSCCDGKIPNAPERYLLYTDKDAQCGWYKGNRITIGFVRERQSETLEYEISGPQDARVTTTEQGKSSSQVILVNGQWMLSEGEDLPNFAAIDALDGPVLFLQTVLGALCKAVPEGPQALKEKKDLNLVETREPISARAGWAHGDIEAPWALMGSIQPDGSGSQTFDLHLEPRKQAAGTILNMHGTWKQDAAAPAPDDDMPLKGWRVYKIGRFKRPNGHMTIIDYGAMPADVNAQQLGQLRSLSAN